MVLRRRLSYLLLPALALVLGLPAGWAEEAPRTAQVTLDLKDYLALVQSAERIERERTQRAANRTEPLVEVSSQKTQVTIREGVAEVKADFEVLVQGHPKSVLPLAAHLVAEGASVEPLTPAALAASGFAPGTTPKSGALLSGSKDQVFLVPVEPGRYAVRLSGAATLTQIGGIGRYVFAPVTAPVAVAEVDLAADLAWSAPGAVVVDDRVEGTRRKVRISARRGDVPTFEVRRKLDGSDAEKLLARAVVLTLLQLGPEGAQRHDVILYEVARGSLASFTVDLPPGLEVERVGTDEGEMVPVAEARRLTLHRRKQLLGTGYLILTSTPDPAKELTLAPLLPGVEVRARYLAVASTIASEAKPMPEADWSRVDLEDLPPLVSKALADLAPTAAWRLSEKAAQPERAEALRLVVARVQPAPLLAAVVRSRQTTTVITIDGTVLHRDRLTLYPISGLTATLDLTLPAGGTLWSVKVDDQAVRPQETNGKVSVPLGFDAGRGPVVEVVSVLEKAIPPGRSQLALDLPRLAVPVQDHQWRLLLPSGASYRFARGDLRPVPVRGPAPGGGWRGSGRMVTVRQEGFVDAAQAKEGSKAGNWGNLYATVVDEQGSTLPGVTVTLTGPGAPQVQVSNAEGQIRFLAMPAGSYAIKAELEGFGVVEVPNIAINAGRNTQAEVTLTAGIEDVITVTAEAGAGEVDEGPIARQRRAGWPKNKRPDGAAASAESVDGTVITDMAAIEGQPAYYDFDSYEEMRMEVDALKSGLVSGVRSLPLTIPENGKIFIMAGLLPPERVGVELEVKGQK